MALIIPTPAAGYPDSTIRVPIDGVTWTFRWLWNEREQTWYVTISDSATEAIAVGVRVVLGVDLLTLVAGSNRPAGELRVVDLTGTEIEATQETLGQNVLVVYVSLEEIEANS
jgi:hypothetical protein